jgi:DNA ligase (NAD+)
VNSAAEGWEAVLELRRDRPRLSFPIDGAVAKLDDVAARSQLGESDHAPRWAIACKYEPEQAVAQIRAITIQVGRTGVLTPVAELQPVELGGSRVIRASLHNRAAVARRDIRVGDFVEVQRAGDVIPAVTAVRLEQRPSGTTPYLFPDRCPSCGEALESGPSEAVVRCLNGLCPAQRQRRLEHFASADAVGIEGLGPATIAILVHEGLVKCPADFYQLRAQDLDGVEGISMASAEKLIAAIERSRGAELWRFLYGLGIPQIGPVNSRKLADSCGSLATFGKWDEERFVGIVGATAGHALSRYLAADLNRANLQALIKNARHEAP